MSLTKPQILTEIRALLNEPTAVFWTDTEINNWIDQAALDISAKTLCYETTSDITLATDTISYAEPAGCLKVHAILYENKPLTKADAKKIGTAAARDAGEPEYWFHYAKKIWLWPVPDSSRTDKKATCLLHASTNDITLIKDEYQPFAILFGLSKGLLKDRKYTQSAHVYQMYLNSLGFHRQDLQMKPADAKDQYEIPDYTFREKQ